MTSAGSELPRSRSASHPSGLLQVSHRLTPRDLRLARLLAEHRTLTTAQIAALLFVHLGTARNRLRQLREIGFLDRFAHRAPDGDRVTCWVPGLLSARYTALAEDRPPPTPRAVRAGQDRIVANPQLDHLLGVNQFFTDLAHHARTHPGAGLLRWWSAERTAATFAGRIHPDGHGLWQAGQDGASTDGAENASLVVGFWLEHDTGSMPVTRLVAKLEAYGRLQQSGGPSFPVIFWLPNRLREKHLHEALAMGPVHADVAVVTGVHGPGRGDPTVAVWAIADSSTSSDVATPASRVTLGALSRWSTSLTLPAESTESPWQ